MDSSTTAEMQNIKEQMAGNLQAVRGRIVRAAERAGRNHDDVTIIAVTKTFDVGRIRLAYELGLRQFGENRVQEAEGKIRRLDLPVTWHLVGHLQTNKAKDAVALFDVIHSVDSLRIAQAIDRYAQAKRKRLSVLLEVNIAGEESKSGFTPQDVLRVAGDIVGLPSLNVEGLMTIAPIVADPEDARPFFRQLTELRDELKRRYPTLAWKHLSMGMTDDFEVAIEEGATMVRIGRAIFGQRPQ